MGEWVEDASLLPLLATQLVPSAPNRWPKSFSVLWLTARRPFIAVACGNRVLVLDGNDLTVHQALEECESAVRAVEFHAASAKLVVGVQCDVLVYEPVIDRAHVGWELVAQLSHPTPVLCVSWSACGEFLAVGGNRVWLWRKSATNKDNDNKGDKGQGEAQGAAAVGERDVVGEGLTDYAQAWVSPSFEVPVYHVAFSPDTRLFVTATKFDSHPKVWYLPLVPPPPPPSVPTTPSSHPLSPPRTPHTPASHSLPQPALTFLYLPHSCSVVHMSWRPAEEGSFVRNALLTTTRNGECHVWTETDQFESMFMVKSASLRPCPGMLYDWARSPTALPSSSSSHSLPSSPSSPSRVVADGAGERASGEGGPEPAPVTPASPPLSPIRLTTSPPRASDWSEAVPAVAAMWGLKHNGHFPTSVDGASLAGRMGARTPVQHCHHWIVGFPRASSNPPTHLNIWEVSGLAQSPRGTVRVSLWGSMPVPVLAPAAPPLCSGLHRAAVFCSFQAGRAQALEPRSFTIYTHTRRGVLARFQTQPTDHALRLASSGVTPSIRPSNNTHNVAHASSIQDIACTTHNNMAHQLVATLSRESVNVWVVAAANVEGPHSVLQAQSCTVLSSSLPRLEPVAVAFSACGLVLCVAANGPSDAKVALVDVTTNSPFREEIDLTNCQIRAMQVARGGTDGHSSLLLATTVGVLHYHLRITPSENPTAIAISGHDMPSAQSNVGDVRLLRAVPQCPVPCFVGVDVANCAFLWEVDASGSDLRCACKWRVDGPAVVSVAVASIHLVATASAAGVTVWRRQGALGTEYESAQQIDLGGVVGVEWGGPLQCPLLVVALGDRLATFAPDRSVPWRAKWRHSVEQSSVLVHACTDLHALGDHLVLVGGATSEMTVYTLPSCEHTPCPSYHPSAIQELILSGQLNAAHAALNHLHDFLDTHAGSSVPSIRAPSAPPAAVFGACQPLPLVTLSQAQTPAAAPAPTPAPAPAFTQPSTPFQSSIFADFAPTPAPAPPPAQAPASAAVHAPEMSSIFASFMSAAQPSQPSPAPAPAPAPASVASSLQQTNSNKPKKQQAPQRHLSQRQVNAVVELLKVTHLEGLSFAEQSQLSKLTSMLPQLQDGAVDRFAEHFLVRSAVQRPPTFVGSCAVWCAWLSESQEFLASACMPDPPLWTSLRQLGVGYWLKPPQLRLLIEKSAKAHFLVNKDPKDSALLYVALRRMPALAALFKAVGDTKLYHFFSNDFSTERWSKAAVKNAFVLLGKQQYAMAAALFLVAGDLDDCLKICIKNLDDVQLAFVVACMYHGDDHDATHSLLRDHVIPLAQERQDPWLESFALLRLGQPSDAVAALAKPGMSEPSLPVLLHALSQKPTFRSETTLRQAQEVALWKSVSLHVSGDALVSGVLGLVALTHLCPDAPEPNLWLRAQLRRVMLTLVPDPNADFALPSPSELDATIKDALDAVADLCGVDDGLLRADALLVCEAQTQFQSFPTTLSLLLSSGARVPTVASFLLRCAESVVVTAALDPFQMTRSLACDLLAGGLVLSHLHARWGELGEEVAAQHPLVSLTLTLANRLSFGVACTRARHFAILRQLTSTPQHQVATIEELPQWFESREWRVESDADAVGDDPPSAAALSVEVVAALCLQHIVSQLHAVMLHFRNTPVDARVQQALHRVSERVVQELHVIGESVKEVAIGDSDVPEDVLLMWHTMGASTWIAEQLPKPETPEPVVTPNRSRVVAEPDVPESAKSPTEAVELFRARGELLACFDFAGPGTQLAVVCVNRSVREVPTKVPHAPPRKGLSEQPQSHPAADGRVISKSLSVGHLSGGDGAESLGGVASHSLAVSAVCGHRRIPAYVVGSTDGEVHVVEVGHGSEGLLVAPPEAKAAGDLALPSHHNARITRIRFNEQGTKLGTCGKSGLLSLCRFDSVGLQANEYEIIAAHKSCNDFAFLNSGSVVATVGKSKHNFNLGIWDVLLPPQKAQIAAATCHVGGAQCLAYSAEHQLLVSGGKKGDVSIFDLRKRRVLHKIPNAHSLTIKSIGLHPVEPCFVTAGNDGDIRVWDLFSAKKLHTFGDAHTKRTFLNLQGDSAVSTYGATQVMFEGDLLFSGGADGRLTVRTINAHTVAKWTDQQ